MNKVVDEFSGRIKDLIQYSKIPIEKKLIGVYLLVNPKAKRFRRKRTIDNTIKELENKIMQTKKESHYRREIEFQTYITQFSREATYLAKQIVETQVDYAYKLFIIAGGDGTYNEIGSGILEANIQKNDDIRLLHFPSGFGNDITEAKDHTHIYDLILGSHKTKKVNALRITDNKENRYYAFNTASLGLDGLVTAFANSFKKRFGGISYKLASVLALPFYTGFYRIKTAHITLYPKNQAKQEFNNSYLIVLMGCKGNSTYGHGMKVLPDSNNVCVVEKMNIFKVIKEEGKFYEGLHNELDEVRFYSCNKLQFDSKSNFFMQYDGESKALKKEHFPITLELLKNRLNKIVED